MQDMKSNNLTDSLRNEQLSSVEFVQDYLQLHFDGKTLTCYVWPIVKSKGIEYKNENLDYKNQLCGLITQKVDDVFLHEGVSLTLSFMNSYEIQLSLDRSDPNLVTEIAILSDDDNNWSIF
ncbi:MAG TPA: hypothetical protein VFM18_08760 [Methanosarcina sp.]|nr:hypothetical protein [Methanosarcina sp.]